MSDAVRNCYSSSSMRAAVLLLFGGRCRRSRYYHRSRSWNYYCIDYTGDLPKSPDHFLVVFSAPGIVSDERDQLAVFRPRLEVETTSVLGDLLNHLLRRAVGPHELRCGARAAHVQADRYNSRRVKSQAKKG